MKQLGSVTLHRDTILLRNFYDTRVTRISIKIRLPGWEEVSMLSCVSWYRHDCWTNKASLAFARRMRGRISDRASKRILDDEMSCIFRRFLFYFYTHNGRSSSRCTSHPRVKNDDWIDYYSAMYWTHVLWKIIECVLRTLYIFRRSANASFPS